MKTDIFTAASGSPYNGQTLASYPSMEASPQQKGLGGSSQGHNVGSRDTDAQELAVEDITNQDANNQPGVEVIYPYQYEEPSADVSNAPVLWNVPKRLEYDEISSSDLVDSIESLRCSSDLENESRQRRCTRHDLGTKRKPNGLNDRGLLSRSDDMGDAMEDWTRPRKVRRLNYVDTPKSDSTGREDDASSNRVTSSETSSDETPSVASQGDPMDID